MALEQRLELKMLQKLILTPQLQQAIKLLQLPQLELSQTIANELVENPLLEEVVEEPVHDDFDVQGSPESESFSMSEDDTEAPLERLVGFSVDDYFDSRGYDGRDLGYFSPDIDTTHNQSLEQYVSDGTDLYDHLNWQLRFAVVPEEIREAAEVVIGNIDEQGYLRAGDEEMCNYSGATVEVVREAIKLVQTFDPPGICARNLKECLVLQLGPLELKGSLVETLILNNLEDIERRKYQAMAQQYGLSLDEIKNAIKVIENLEPKPGRGMAGPETVYIKPDVYVVRDDEEFRIILNDESVPHIRINSFYRKLLAKKNTLQKEERDYLEERLRSAEWLLKSLDHRNKTIYRVSESIVTYQRAFFLDGPSQLRPLTLKDVATDLGMHESTISRATSNKYMSCEHGLLSFRFFFSSSVSAATGAVSSTSVKELIGKIISEEDVKKPLSDQKISEMLKTFNITVARRTVAKYREELNTPPQNIRKRTD